MNAHIIETIAINEQFINKLFILIKKIGMVPKNKPMVVKPNESPGLLFKIETITPKVMDIVMLNNRTPINDKAMILSPKHKNGIEIKTLNIPTFLMPNLSDKIPPSALPVPINVNNKIVSKVVLFQDVGIP